MEFKPNAKILIIDSLKDFIAKVPYYHYLSIGQYKYYAPDFEKLKQQYDALYLTENGQYETHYPDSKLTPIDFFGWDVETVLIMNPNCIHQI